MGRQYIAGDFTRGRSGHGVFEFVEGDQYTHAFTTTHLTAQREPVLAGNVGEVSFTSTRQGRPVLVGGMSVDASLPLPMDGPERATPPDFEQLRIIITGTPKTGNTWLRHLLSQLYSLPQVELDPSFHGNDFESFGRRWIGQQHYQPDADIIASGEQRGIIFIAPLRHPGDVLVSLRHHIEKQSSPDQLTDNLRALLPEAMLEDGPHVFGENTRRFVQNGFFVNLHLSISWLRGGWALGVRYEDLWRNPLETLRTVSDRLVPRSTNQLRHALCACEIGLMQSNYDPEKTFVRKGGLNSWPTVLPDEIKQELATREPYPTQFDALGYTMDATAAANARSEEPTAAGNPFRRSTFANDIAVAPIHLRAYFDLPDEMITRWPDACAVDEDSFYGWLMRPAAADPERATAIPVVTEFAHWLYSTRADVREAWPEPFGQHRQAVCDWFLFSATEEYQFDRHFGVPILTSLARGRPAGI